MTQVTGSEAQHAPFACVVDGQPCEVMAAFPCVPDPCREVISCLPCNECRLVETHAAGLSGVRLGKHERRLLLEASLLTGTQKVRVTPAVRNASLREAHRRAARKLVKAGLVIAHSSKVEARSKRTTHYVYDREARRWRYSSVPEPVTMNVEVRTITLSPLGAALVGFVSDDLEAGSRIRWDKHRGRAISQVRKATDELVDSFADSIADSKPRHDERLASAESKSYLRMFALHLREIVRQMDSILASRS